MQYSIDEGIIEDTTTLEDALKDEIAKELPLADELPDNSSDLPPEEPVNDCYEI